MEGFARSFSGMIVPLVSVLDEEIRQSLVFSNVTFVSAVHSLNTALPIVVTPLPISMFLSEVQ